MPIMLAITVVAFIALAWAVISIARHIRGVRAQRRKAVATARHEAAGTQQAPQAVTTSPNSAPEPVFVATPPPPPPVSEATLPRFPLSSQRIRAASAINIPAAAPTPPPAPVRRPPASVPADDAYSNFFSNAEYGDLSDPEPSQRPRSRSASAKQVNARS